MESIGTKSATIVLPEDIWSVIISNINLYDTIFLRATSHWLYSACKKYRPFPKHYVLDQDNFMAYLIENGSVSCLEYVKYALYFEWTEEQSTSAARTGNVDVLKYLCHTGCPVNSTTVLLECTKGTCDINMIKYLHESGVSWEQEDPKSQAIGPLTNDYYERDNNVQIVAENMAFHGHVECLKYAVENGCKDKRIWYTPSIECLNFVIANGFDWKGGIGSQQLGMLGVPRPVKLSFCEQAARLGDLTMLKYAFERGAPLQESESIAAKAGHLECLKFCFEQMPLNNFRRMFSSPKTIECCKFYYEKLGRQFIESNSPLLWMTAAHGSVDYLKFLHEKIAMSEVLYFRGAILTTLAQSLDTLKFAHEILKLSFIGRHPYLDLTRNGNLEVLHYIKENMLSSWKNFNDATAISSIINSAVLSKDVAVLKFIWEHFPNKKGQFGPALD